jgi:uncharacterized protein YukE
MSDPKDFWDFIDQIDDKIEDIINDICDAADDAADALDDAVNSIGARLGRLWPGESDAEKAVDKWNEEICPAIEQGISDIRTKVGEAVGDFSGNPGNLLDYADAFVAAKATLYKQNTLNQDVTNLGNTWTGGAYATYAAVAGEQSDALLALSNNLQKGGELTTQGADKILSIWLELVRDLVSYAGDAISVIGGFADVGKALGGWISAAADAIALIWTTVGDIAADFTEWWKTQITEAALGWNMLSAGFDGMAENKWPRISESSSDGINNPANWPS